MRDMAVNRKRTVCVFVLTILLIAVSRGLSLNHNSYLHPDENVFVSAAVSLKDKVMGLSDEYVEAKEYPEGAYVFQLPFHIAAQLYRQATDRPVDGFTVGRIASVVYFSIAVGLGFALLYRFIDNRTVALLTFAATTVFSLFHMEQSRYGTGDAITLCLLMAVIFWSAKACEGRRPLAFLLIAAIFCGFLSAVKYPLIFFLCIPAAVLWRVKRRLFFLKRVGLTGILGIAALIGFLICSPKVVLDPRYVLRVILTESRAYVRGGNLFTLGGWYNHVASLAIYSLFYSGFPFASGLMCYAFFFRWKKNGIRTDIDFLFNLVIPIAVTVFFLYSVSVVSLFMRSCYPFFFLADLYAATAVSELYCRRRRGIRFGLCIMGAILICRGSFFLLALTERNGSERLNQLITEAKDENWTYTSLLATRPLSGPYLAYDKNLIPDAEEIYIQDERFLSTVTAELKPGELLITGTEDFSRSNRYIIPFDNEMVHDLIRNWEAFQTVNKNYYVGQPYPRYYYYLFGFWIKGTTGTDYEFPTNYVYYRSE